MVEELWKPVIGYENIYEISNLGSVRSLPREVPFLNGTVRKLKGKILKPLKDKNGYQYVYLAKSGSQKFKFVHRLVAEAFLGDAESLEVNHIDGDKSNNSVTNLEWITHKDNIVHSFETGLHSKPLTCHMKEISKLGNKISIQKSSQPVVCLTDNLAFISQNAADRYYGYYLGSVCDAITNREGRFKGKLFRKLDVSEVHNFDLLS